MENRKLDQGKKLASRLFDLKLTELEKMSEEQKKLLILAHMQLVLLLRPLRNIII